MPALHQQHLTKVIIIYMKLYHHHLGRVRESVAEAHKQAHRPRRSIDFLCSALRRRVPHHPWHTHSHTVSIGNMRDFEITLFIKVIIRTCTTLSITTN